MKDDQEQRDGALVSSQKRDLLRRSTQLIRRGLHDLTKRRGIDSRKNRMFRTLLEARKREARLIEDEKQATPNWNPQNLTPDEEAQFRSDSEKKPEQSSKQQEPKTNWGKMLKAYQAEGREGILRRLRAMRKPK
ncbi:MAG: hypothetical protein ACRD9S_05860 [Pyrinomonadaceae bacterium]